MSENTESTDVDFGPSAGLIGTWQDGNDEFSWQSGGGISNSQ